MQRIAVFQQQGSGAAKIHGIETHGRNLRIVKIFSIDEALPPIVDDPEDFLPQEIEADLVLDFLVHPDLSHELAQRCRELKIPVVAPGKKHRIPGVFTPPT
jgi:hypothetical protein